MSAIFDLIDAQTTIQDLAARLCWCAKDSPTGRSVGAKKDFKHYTFRWNLANLEKAKGTIEFRQPPGSTNPTKSIAWIMFAVCFARSASQNSTRLNPSIAGQLDQLQRFVVGGAEICGIQDVEPLVTLFRGAQPLQVGPLHDLKDISKDEVEKLSLKARERDISLEKYKMLFGYK